MRVKGDSNEILFLRNRTKTNTKYYVAKCYFS